MKTKKDYWDKMYSLPTNQIPWEIESPPSELLYVLENYKVPGRKVLDIACGTGNYSIFLAQREFDVTGIDFSSEAISIARSKVAQNNIQVIFIEGNITKLGKLLSSKFSLVVDYSILHHISPSSIKNYAKQFSHLLAPRGKLLLVCYSEKDKDAKGKKMRWGYFGNIMYYRNAKEIQEYYQDLKLLLYKEIQLGKRLQHAGHFFLFEKD